jgi:hypothetical protein
VRTTLRIEVISTGMLKTLWKRRLKVTKALRIGGIFTSLHQTVAFPKMHEQAQTFLPFNRKLGGIIMRFVAGRLAVGDSCRSTLTLRPNRSLPNHVAKLATQLSA